ncbi:hypothetical protein DRH29_05130 [candidate division Kazan bacterium]|uniref:Uncharacterized protein n=1 Tax=candidate division Kazan bacterium TaxID=2202143 RepID=A0A420ZBB7_UNCK3|nr:MAG: hypothetical protein DRH29_05130 [candidate division Kazan bacterium]
MYIIAGRKLDKSPERLAMEVKGKNPYSAYNHLLRYGLTEAEAAPACRTPACRGHSGRQSGREVVALFRGRDKVNGTVREIAGAVPVCRPGRKDAVRTVEGGVL